MKNYFLSFFVLILFCLKSLHVKSNELNLYTLSLNLWERAQPIVLECAEYLETPPKPESEYLHKEAIKIASYCLNFQKEKEDFDKEIEKNQAVYFYSLENYQTAYSGSGALLTAFKDLQQAKYLSFSFDQKYFKRFSIIYMQFLLENEGCYRSLLKNFAKQVKQQEDFSIEALIEHYLYFRDNSNLFDHFIPFVENIEESLQQKAFAEANRVYQSYKALEVTSNGNVQTLNDTVYVYITAFLRIAFCQDKIYKKYIEQYVNNWNSSKI